MTQLPELRGNHDLRTREAGPQRCIALHLQVDRDLSVEQAHELSREVSARIEQRAAQGEPRAPAAST